MSSVEIELRKIFNNLLVSLGESVSNEASPINYRKVHCHYLSKKKNDFDSWSARRNLARNSFAKK